MRHWFEQQCRRQTLGGLHHAKDELPGDAADLLVHAEGADVIVDRALSVDTHGGEVVEDDGQVAVDQRSDLFGQFDLDPLDMVHQRVHGAQEMLVGHGVGHGRHRDGLQPAQAAQLAAGVAEAIEHHGPHQGLDVEPALARPQGAPERAVEAQFLPHRMQGKDVAEAPCRLVHVPRRMTHRKPKVAKAEDVAVADRVMVGPIMRILLDTDAELRDATEPRDEFPRARQKVGMDMRFEYMRDREAERLRPFDVDIAVGTPIYNRGGSGLGVTEKVRTLRHSLRKNLFKTHGHWRYLPVCVWTAARSPF